MARLKVGSPNFVGDISLGFFRFLGCYLLAGWVAINLRAEYDFKMIKTLSGRPRLGLEPRAVTY